MFFNKIDKMNSQGRSLNFWGNFDGVGLGKIIIGKLYMLEVVCQEIVQLISYFILNVLFQNFVNQNLMVD